MVPVGLDLPKSPAVIGKDGVVDGEEAAVAGAVERFVGRALFDDSAVR